MGELGFSKLFTFYSGKVEITEKRSNHLLERMLNTKPIVDNEGPRSGEQACLRLCVWPRGGPVFCQGQVSLFRERKNFKKFLQIKSPVQRPYLKKWTAIFPDGGRVKEFEYGLDKNFSLTFPPPLMNESRVFDIFHKKGLLRRWIKAHERARSAARPSPS